MNNPDTAYEIVMKLEDSYRRRAMASIGNASYGSRDIRTESMVEQRVSSYMKGMFIYVLTHHSDSNTLQMLQDYIVENDLKA